MLSEAEYHVHILQRAIDIEKTKQGMQMDSQHLVHRPLSHTGNTFQQMLARFDNNIEL
jgi:hypothetical protein